MADRYSSVYSLINNFWHIGDTIHNRVSELYPDITQETLIQQNEWSDQGSVMSPAMGELSFNQINPPTPPAPPAPPAPPVTEQGEPSGLNNLFSSIKEGISLKPTKTIVKDNSMKGKSKEIDNPPVASTSNIENNSPVASTSRIDPNRSITEALSIQFDKLRKVMRGSDDGEDNVDELDSNNHSLDTIKPDRHTLDELRTNTFSTWDDGDNFTTHGKFVGQLGLNPELVVKLKNVNVETDKEILTEISGFTPDLFISEVEKHNLENMENIISINIDNNIQKIIDENPGINKQLVTETLIAQNPQHKNKIFKYVESSLNKQLSEIESKFTPAQTEKLHKVLRNEDLKELQILNQKPSVDSIRAAVSVNRTHSNLLNEVKSKSFSNTKFEETMNLFD